ncbi:E3 ubiquitin-protein like [Actinidia chinensis var. chinensis]|uniref:RING-type E3 ubiquitin transferase n=1 Tax=Actinidia chinensis var. chinensis TaxID=1590841 RepID=A0A2R6QK58_ACTCC|nr:E3 ubiquitin-protein like [Actinidia chinensis var. chinensis]
MSTPSSPITSSSDNVANTTPLLSSAASGDNDLSRRNIRRQSLRGAARFLRRASSRRLMREPSMLVRETAAEQLEERQSDWAYSKPVVVLDMMWNFAFVVVTAVVLVLSYRESPLMPLRLWIGGYALQCFLHMICVFIEYRRRRHSVVDGESLSSSSPGNATQLVPMTHLTDDETSSVAKHLESANTMFSFIWWIMGFYWLSAGGQALAKESPLLYWTSIIFLAFDVLFIVFCVVLACVIGIAVCCCLPCIIAILYAVADQEGAARDDVDQLPKYKFQRVGDIDKLNGETQGPFPGVMTECGTDTPIEHALSQEDAECCICLSAYDDGAELRQLPCAHHFHCTCVDKWLYINATCPLCKYNILKSSNHGSEQV